MDKGVQSAIAGLDDAVAELNRVLSNVPPRLLEPAAWGSREMLVHIVFIHELYVSHLRALTAGEKPPRLTGVHEQNALALSENKTASVRGLMERLRSAQHELSTLAIDSAATRPPVYLKVRSTRRTLEETLAAAASHIRGHIRDIKRLARG